MKKLINCGIAAALCASTLPAQAFAADITEDRSVYAENAEELVAKFDVDFYIADITDAPSITLDPNTIMPFYHADIYDFIRTGKLELAREQTPGRYDYFGDVVDSNREFVGIVEFYESEDGDVHYSCYYPRYNTFGVEQHSCPAAFSYHSEAIKSALAAKGFDTNVKEVKLVFINGLGAVYHIDTGTEKVLVPAWEVAGGVIQSYFPGNTYYDAVIVNEDLRATAIRLEEENNKLLAEAGGFGAGGTGGAGNPSTGGTSSALAGELGIALTACVIGISAAKKKKD
ncbi:MAG: hypothetical protein K2N56_12700 [Oscillospiraceae bacterium]|nr:hypothetical protein [Oscillospiraceae bacterium]